MVLIGPLKWEPLHEWLKFICHVKVQLFRIHLTSFEAVVVMMISGDICQTS